MRATAVAGVLMLGSILLTGCGDGAETAQSGQRETFAAGNGVETVRLTDPAGDVQARKNLSDQPRPPEARLDLRNVEIRRDRDSLRVRFTTAAPPGPGTIQRLIVYDDQLRSRSYIQAEHSASGRVRGTARPADGVGRRVKAGLSGRVVTAEAPLDELTRAPRFKWRARTLSGSPVEIDDRAPSTIGQYRIFPR